MSIAPRTNADGCRVLVTGSEGFLGRHLRRGLAERGCRVIGIDRPERGAEITVDLAAPDFDPDRVWDRVGPADAVVYLAANISRTSSVDTAARRNLRVIAETPVRLMESAVGRGLSPHLVFCSTFKLYGPARQARIDPETHPQRPDPWSYGCAKVLAERLLAIASARSGFTYTVVRPTCIYGPGQHLHNAIPIFLQAAWRGEPPIVFGRGESVRDDVFVRDVADIMAEAALRRVEGTFNAGGEQARTILEVANLCCEAVAEAGGPQGLRARSDAAKPPKPWLDQRFDISRTRSVLGYNPTSLRDGLAAEAAWIAGAPEDATWPPP